MARQYVVMPEGGDSIGPLAAASLDEAILRTLDGRRWKWSVQLQKLNNRGDVTFEGPWREGPWPIVASTFAGAVREGGRVDDYFRIRGRTRKVAGIKVVEVTEPKPGPSEPCYSTMPSFATWCDTPYGRAFFGGGCRDDYANMQVYVQDGSHYLKLQESAIQSLKLAEAAIGGKVYCTGTWRSCGTQSQLWRSDPSRFADPSLTAHCRGLAIDVSQSQSRDKLDAIHRALTARHWYQARADEPWHYSFAIKV